MRVLITGINEHLGSHVAKRCLESGYIIRGIVGDKVNSRELQSVLGQEVEIMDNLNGIAIKDCSHVLHLTDMYPEIDQSKKLLDGILEGAVKYGIKRVIVKGSMFCLGIHSGRKDKLYNENSYPNFNSQHLNHKVLLEEHTWKRIKELPKGFELSFIHPGVMYGPLLINSLNPNIEQIARMMMEKFAYFSLCLPIVDVRDVARACVAALESSKLSKRYVCSGGSLWLNDIPKIIEDEFGSYGYKCRKVLGGRWVMKLAARTKESARFLMQNEGIDFIMKSDLAEKELGISFRPPKQSIIDTVYSLIEKGMIPNKLINKHT